MNFESNLTQLLEFLWIYLTNTITNHNHFGKGWWVYRCIACTYYFALSQAACILAAFCPFLIATVDSFVMGKHYTGSYYIHGRWYQPTTVQAVLCIEVCCTSICGTSICFFNVSDESSKAPLMYQQLCTIASLVSTDNLKRYVWWLHITSLVMPPNIPLLLPPINTHIHTAWFKFRHCILFCLLSSF